MRGVVGVLLLGFIALAHAATPTFAEVRAAYRTSETTFVDRRGEPVQVLRTDPSVRRLGWTTLADVSPALRTALVWSEDRRFYAHAGVDWSAVGAAAWGNLWHTRTRGASTITMQLAGLVDDDLRPDPGGRSIVQKLSQAATALSLERRWRKDEILEAYLNLVGYRGELVGVAALSATLFGKYPSGLDAREAAITAALVRAPNATPARVAERACAVLVAERLDGECRGLPDYTAQVLASRAAPRLDADAQIAPHFARAVSRDRRRLDARAAAAPVAKRATSAATDAGAMVTTTLDARLQRFARQTLRAHLAELAARNVEDGAVVVLDNATGDVLAWVGSSGGLSAAADVDHALAPRQAGSTLKPFLYALAIERRWLTAASIVDDSPIDLATAGGLYIPKNYDHDFKGPVSVRTALASSLNVPAVRTLVMVTPERFHQRLRTLGFSTLRESGDYYGYSLALGSADVTLVDLTNAYRALANDGDAGPVRLVPEALPPARRRAIDAGASRIVADILADRDARTVTFGMDSVLATRRWSAVKTGTSKDMRDNWCVGFTGRYTVGVWVGNSGGAAMWDVSGTTGAAPVWHAIVDYLGRRDGPDDARTASRDSPTGVVRQAVRFDGDLEAPRTELFLPGTETRLVVATANAARGSNGRRSQGAARAAPTIGQPVDGTIVAIDPDIPPQHQKLTFALAGAAAGTDRGPASTAWRLDGTIVGRGPVAEWPVWPGRHLLELLDAAGRPIDRVAFEVRGASVRSVASHDRRR